MKKARKERGPSRASLREIPEINFEHARVRRNPWAARIAAEGMTLPGRGRPRKGHETGPSIPRSVRFPAAVWSRLEGQAKAQGMTLHAALRAAIVAWVKSAE